MDFNLTDDQRAILETVRDFCKAEIAPLAAQFDRSGEYPWPQLGKLAELGLLGASVPETWGGSGLSSVTYALCLEEISAADASVGVIVSVTNGLPQQMILKHGTDAQKERFLHPLAQGKHVGAFCLTEANSGSDAASLRTRATHDGDGWVLEGQKVWITSGGQADTYLVMARTDEGEGQVKKGARGITAFILEKNTPGLSFGKPEEKLGLHAAHTTTVNFDGVRVPDAQRLGTVGEGLVIALSSLDGGRIGIAMQAIGIARAAFEAARDYAIQREQFGSKIAEFEGISFKIADMATRIDAARLLALRAASLRDAGKHYSKEAAMAKLFASDTAMFVTREAIQVFGGNGYSREYPVERYYRDAKITEIYEGTSEIQRLVISRQIFRDLMHG
jgi:alkylation response protein AidB-like acyl-CoA dehydrogenase